MSSKNPLKDPEYIIAFGVVLISVCALVVSIRQTNIMSEQRALMHEQAKAAVWPRITMGIGKSHSLEDRSVTAYKLSVNNAGVGPAIIKYVRISFKGTPANNWWDLFKLFDMDDSVPTYITNANISQNIIRAGDDLRILDLTDNLLLAQEFYKNSNSITYEVYYESIYGDMWKYTLSGRGEKTEVIDTKPEFKKEEEFES